MRDEFLKMLDTLNTELTVMVNSVKSAIMCSVNALVKQDISYCKYITIFKEEIRAKKNAIEALCTAILIKQQPVASDFALVNSAQKMIVDLERMGEIAVDISQIALKLSAEPNVKEYDLIPKMAEETIRVLNLSLQAFINKDISEINDMECKDDVVDSLFEQVKKEISEIIIKNPTSIDVGLEILMVAKYFEKIGDHAVNIANHVKSSMNIQ